MSSDIGSYECTVKIGQDVAVARANLSQLNDASGEGSGQFDQELTILDDFVTDISATVDPDCLENPCPGSITTVLNLLGKFQTDSMNMKEHATTLISVETERSLNVLKTAP